MIQLRNIQSKDKEQIYIWRNLPEVAQYMYSDHTITLDEHTKWFDNMLVDDSNHYWIIELDNEGVGVANITEIDNINSRCFWAFYLASPAVRGRGVGSYVEHFVMRYVFEELDLNKLCCEVLSFNENVVAMHKKFGFEQEGLFRSHIRKNGEFMDVVCLAILQSSWFEVKQDIEVKLRSRGLIE